MHNDEIKDITSIPFFAFEPSLLLWVSLIIISLILIILIQAAKLKLSKKTKSDVFSLSVKDLRTILGELAPQSDSRKALTQASLNVRRLLSAVEDSHIAGLSETELKFYADQMQIKCLKDLLTSLIELEKVKYAQHTDYEQSKLMIGNLIAALEKYNMEVRKS